MKLYFGLANNIITNLSKATEVLYRPNSATFFTVCLACLPSTFHGMHRANTECIEAYHSEETDLEATSCDTGLRLVYLYLRFAKK